MAKKKRTPGPFEDKPIPVKLDSALLGRIDNIAKEIGEGRSTIMRLAMRFGLAAIERMIEHGEDVASALARPGQYPEHRNQTVIIEDRDNPEGKK